MFNVHNSPLSRDFTQISISYKYEVVTYIKSVLRGVGRSIQRYEAEQTDGQKERGRKVPGQFIPFPKTYSISHKECQGGSVASSEGDNLSGPETSCMG